MNVNTELLYYDPNSFWFKHIDCSFAAITFALLEQHEAFKSNLRQLIEWSHSPTCILIAETLYEKDSELFIKNFNYMKVPKDLL